MQYRANTIPNTVDHEAGKLCSSLPPELAHNQPLAQSSTFMLVAESLLNDEENPNAVSAETPDWSREHKRIFEWAPSRALLASIRAYQHYASSHGWWAAFLRKVAVLRHRWWSVVTGADIPLNCHLGGGLLLPHPNGIVIHPHAEIGPNCLLFQQVTVGSGKGGAPKIGGHVDVGAGAKILGGVTIGQNAKIGANCVVLDDVPPGATAVGVPARILTARSKTLAKVSPTPLVSARRIGR